MNPKTNLIIGNGKDITSSVEFCEYNQATQKYDVTFRGGKRYSYNYNSIEWVREPATLSPALMSITHHEQKLIKVQGIYVFRTRTDDYWHICFSNGSSQTYPRRELKIVQSCLSEKEPESCINYLREIATLNELKSDDGTPLLENQYSNLDFVGNDTALAIYLNPAKYNIREYNTRSTIFPFGGNTNQFKAVKQALVNQISVIQGPPGTGKTQTILNIIANLVAEGKTVQVVSNNNSATENVFEKLASSKYNLGFLVAPLGNALNKKKFVESQSETYPDIASWEITKEAQAGLLNKINSSTSELSVVFANQEQLAQARLELDALLLEARYFEQYCAETGIKYDEKVLRHRLKSKTIMKLWQECNAFSERERMVSLWFKIKSILIYGVSNWAFYKSSLSDIITLLQMLFYKVKEAELTKEISGLEITLAARNAKGEMDELTKLSMAYLRGKLFERYGKQIKRPQFTENDLRKRPNELVSEYPIVLSTTFASRSCLKGVVYDYLIMDEASQVDIATGVLALSGAKNVVIVGDLKQLSNVVKDDVKRQSDAIFASYNLPQGYSFSENSFLKSVCSILPNVPQTLLREHYRCHPKIIGFCNQKFYNNELIIMTQDYGEPDTLLLFKTVEGNHRRDRANQRQIDLILREALPKLGNYEQEEVGIIAPYIAQVTSISAQLGASQIEVDTVHKFQGREKDTIVLTTVDDVITVFSDDPHLLNVAISRAKNKLCVVTSGNDQPKDSNMADLISYIEYNNFQVVHSEIYSVFDLLYKQYTNARISFLANHTRVSEYDSENLMYGALVDLIGCYPQVSLDILCHYPLNMIIRDPKYLTSEECKYAMNKATHVDFLIFERISKKPVLAIEVDGFHYHKKGTQQYERDKVKDRIFSAYGIPLLRFATNGSDEVRQIRQALDEYKNSR